MGTNNHLKLSEIKATELEALSISSCVSSRFSISWSDDDKVAIIAEEGVFIFELWPTPLSDNQVVAFMKFCILSSAMAPESEGGDYTFLWSLNRKNAFELALDPTISHIAGKPYSPCNSHIIKCEFSPKIFNQCYISCLTNTGSVQIFKKEFNSWKSVINITKEWNSYCGIHANFVKTDYEDLKDKLSQIKITSIKWHSEPCPVFITSHKSGVINIWNIDLSKGDLSMTVGSSINSKFHCSVLDLLYIKEYHSTILIAGVLSGPVKGFLIDTLSGDPLDEFTLWEIEDAVAPDSITMESSGGQILVLIVKRHLLLVSKILVTPLRKVDVGEVKPLTFSSVISGLSKGPDCYLLCLSNHSIYSLNVEKYCRKNELACDLNMIDLGIKTKLKNSYHCYGLTMSQNKAIWILASSAKINYDSLKDITILSLYTAGRKKFRELEDTTCTGIIDKIVKTYGNTQLNVIYDFLELKRLELLLDDSKFKSSYDFHQDMSLLELKLLLWEAKLKQYCASAEMNSTISSLESLIAKKQSKKLVEKFQNTNLLSDDEKRSLKTNLNFLSQFENEGSPSENEKCSICGCEVIADNIRTSSCANNHIFPRCCISLLPCDSFPYAVCQKCDSVALMSFVSENSSHCLFCDGLLIANTRFRP